MPPGSNSPKCETQDVSGISHYIGEECWPSWPGRFIITVVALCPRARAQDQSLQTICIFSVLTQLPGIFLVLTMSSLSLHLQYVSTAHRQGSEGSEALNLVSETHCSPALTCMQPLPHWLSFTHLGHSHTELALLTETHCVLPSLCLCLLCPCGPAGLLFPPLLLAFQLPFKALPSLLSSVKPWNRLLPPFAPQVPRAFLSEG